MKVFAGQLTVEQEVSCANKLVAHKSKMAPPGNEELQMPPGDVAELVTLVPFTAFHASSQFLMIPGENAPWSSTLSQHTTDTPFCGHHGTDLGLYMTPKPAPRA